MNPLLKNKVDVKSLSPEEQRLFRLYGKLPSRSDHFAKHLKERKYFDSGDYAMSKAGKGNGLDTCTVGSQHPVPENIPHLSSPTVGAVGGIGAGALNHGGPMQLHPHYGPQHMQAGSPVKESSFLHRETSADEMGLAEDLQQKEKPENNGDNGANAAANGGGAPQQGQMSEGIPIRR